MTWPGGFPRRGGVASSNMETARRYFDRVGVAIAAGAKHREAPAPNQLLETGVRTVLSEICPFGLRDGQQVILHAGEAHSLHGVAAGATWLHAFQIEIIAAEHDGRDDDKGKQSAHGAGI